MATKTDDNQNDAEPEEIVDVDQESEEASEEIVDVDQESEKASIEEENIEEAKELSPLEQLEEQIRLKDDELLKQKDTFLRRTCYY